jgi:hypothetical protein
MVRASEAKVEWNAEKKHWQVVIQVGAEVIRRTCRDSSREAADDDLRSVALATAKDEGYELDPSHVLIVR